ncbi:MAG: hypothetical protein Q8N51_12215 [Gammaproteobacteria bacterium]|nr:hypothetical protein [Gammaproteobacteria bacterium]
MIRSQVQMFSAALVVALVSSAASASTLTLDSSWVSTNGINVVSWDGPNTGLPLVLSVPGSYTYSHNISAANAPFTVPGSVSGTYPLGFEFYDDYIFQVPGATANSVTSTISMGTLLGISNLQARIYSYTTLPQVGPVGGLIAQAWGTMFSCGTGCSGETVIVNNVLLNPGIYVLELRGIVSGAVSGSYGGALNVVPVPAAVWLFGSALMGIACFRRRAPLHG